MNATVELLEAVGYHRLTIEKVAARAGVGKATVYRWWQTKPRLVAEALSARCVLDPVPRTGDLRTEMRSLVTRTIELATTSTIGHTLPQLAAETKDGFDSRSLVAKCLQPVRAAHVASIADATARGELPQDLDVDLILDIIFGTVLYRILLGEQPGPALIDQLTALVVDQALPQVGTPRSQLI